MLSSKEHQAALNALLGHAETVSALERHYERTIDRILRELALGVSRPGAARARELLARLAELAGRLNPRRQGFLRDWIRRNLEDSFVLGDESAIDGIKSAFEGAPRQVVGGWTAVNQTALAAMVSEMDTRLRGVAAQLEQLLGVAVRRTQLVFHQDAAIRESVISGIIRGASGRRLSDDIASIILNGGTPAEVQRLRAAGFQPDLVNLYKQLSEGRIVTAGGKTMDVRQYANLVARTMMRDAHTFGAIARLQENDVNHVRVSNPPRVGRPDVCTVFAGRVLYVGPGEDPLGFPSLRSVPGGKIPFHPNCRHSVQPWVAAIKGPAEIQRTLDDTRLIPGDYLNKTAAQVNELVGSLDAAALQKLNPNAAKPREAA